MVEMRTPSFDKDGVSVYRWLHSMMLQIIHLWLTRRFISNYTPLAGEDHDVEFGNSDKGPG